MNKKILSLLLVTILFAGVSKAQFLIADQPTSKSGMSAFMDASSFTDENGAKVLIFPFADLTTFELNTEDMDGGDAYPSYFDGALVFNTEEGTAKSGQPILVSRGFYYFDNPDKNVADGKWKRLGATSISADPNNPNEIPEIVTGEEIDGKTVYMSSGSFVQAKDKGETQFELAVPKGKITQFYQVSIFNDNVATNTVYSLKPNGEQKAELITGAPNMSVVYPEGTYKYIIKYFKD